jgi:hypothetical protein
LSELFGVNDIAKHQFKEIISWHDPKESTPLRREMLRFSQISTKNAFDDVFVKYGRSLKPDLIVAQWNHLGDFNQIVGDERCLLPPELWGRNEDYLWYSLGNVGQFTDLNEEYLGEGTLQARYIRGAFDDKPFTLGKYESTRIRVAIAELAANGGSPMGFYTNFSDPMARNEIVRYYRFLERYDNLFRGNRPCSETVLIFPRSRVHKGDLDALENFKKLGKKLLGDHVLFDVKPDDSTTPEQLKSYKHVFDGSAEINADPKSIDGLSHFDAPFTVRVSVSRPLKGEEITIHLVNYNREEPGVKRGPGTGIIDEKPIGIEAVKVSMVPPVGFRITKVESISPESPDPIVVPFEWIRGRAEFTIPKFLVYSIARLGLEREPAAR